MNAAEHRKHADLARPSLGNFGRNEWAVLGTPCPAIKKLAEDIIAALSISYKCAYVDAAHVKEGQTAVLPGRLAAGAFAEYSDKINHHEFVFNKKFNAFGFQEVLHEADLILVNGNHQQSKSQVVVIDKVKEASLKRKLSQLTDVQLFLMAEGETTIFDFVKEAIPHWEKIPVFSMQERGKIVAFFRDKMELAVPKINGLVLAGGRSLRLGSDKGKINWHGKEQREYIAELLQPFCNEVFISCREEQRAELKGSFQTVTDTFTGLGPYGAILSAFREQPDAAWLVVACDLPLLDSSVLNFLVKQRNQSCIATTFQSPHDGLPEPLVTIWEPKSYPVLLSFLAQGYSCPRKVLINSEAAILQPPFPNALMNVNTQEEFQKANALLGRKTV